MAIAPLTSRALENTSAWSQCSMWREGFGGRSTSAMRPNFQITSAVTTMSPATTT